MTAPLIVCIDCPTLIPKGSGSRRCQPCRQAHNRRKNNTPQAIARRKTRQPGLYGECVCCHIIGPLTRDHIIPLIQGGKTTADNVQYLCLSCNSSKGAGTECLLHASNRSTAVICGTNSSYHTGCRCQECTDAHRRYQNDYNSRQRQERIDRERKSSGT